MPAPTPPALTVRAEPGDIREQDVDVLVVPVLKGGIEGPGAGVVLAALGLEDLPVNDRFRGDIGQTLPLAAHGVAARSVLLVGLGRMVDVDPGRLRDAAAVAATALRRARTVATTLAEVHATPASVQAVAEGLLLGAHEDRRFRGTGRGDDDPSTLAEATVLTPSSRLTESRRAVRRAQIVAQATIAARELVTAPPATKTPDALAEALAETGGACCGAEILDEAGLAARGCGGLLAVGAGSAAPPRLLRLRYQPDEPLGQVALVGKGITFDSGGLSLKDAAAMPAMKADMAGAASIAAACGALEDLKVRVAVDAWLPLAENLPSGGAYRPGDVVRHPDGSSTEVVDTDAEGRLVLADALALAAGEEPDALVDLATLTGAASRAVGPYASVVMATDDDLLGAVRAAADAAGERLWPLPLWADLDRFLHSEIADHRQIGDGPHGDPRSDVIMAGLYLRRFVGDLPWLHLDAPALWLDDDLAFGAMPGGATGFGVRTLLSWLAP